jgi:hypothetical protein
MNNAMTGKSDGENQRGWSRLRIAAWCSIPGILLIPLIAMQFSDDVLWTLSDFVIIGALLVGTGLTYEMVVRKAVTAAYRVAAGIACFTGLFLIWVNLAVGIIGDENNSANMMFFGVLSIGIIGAILVRLEPKGMARVLCVMAGAQILIAVIALIGNLGSTSMNWPRDVLGVTGILVTLWLISAALFREAARD